MSDIAVRLDAGDAETVEEWLARMDSIGEEAGHFEPLGESHAALFLDDGTDTLLVTFETVAAIRAGSAEQMPLGSFVARPKGWSHLCLIADGETWYRDRHVWAYFDRLVDDAFFEDFDRVVLYGAGMGGYAAAAFSVAAPGATVVALAPQATLAPDRAGWDTRFTAHRRKDFTSRYGYAPDMTEGAGEVFVIYDPARAPDAMHATLFDRPWVTRLRSPLAGRDLEGALSRMGILAPLLTAAGEGRLDAALFHRLYRARRDDPACLLRLCARAEARHNARHKAAVEGSLLHRACKAALSRADHPHLQRMLAGAGGAGPDTV